MTIANYISDLLYRYECVIVPNFGGFVTNEISAKVNHFTHTFYPPTKQLSFNAQLKNNDGLLANYMASVEQISFKDAVQKITALTDSWNTQLQNGTVVLENIGTLSLNSNQKIVFEPAYSVNYLTDSFGLSKLNSPAIKRIQYKEQVKQLERRSPVVHKKKTPVYLKYAATAAIALTLSGFGWNTIKQQQFEKQQQLAEQQQQKALEEKIQQATFVIDSPLPEITLNVVKEKPKNYHIIAGAFRFPQNAAKKVNQLKSKGFDAQIIGVNKWDLTQVSFDSFETRQEALQNLQKIKRSFSKDAWLLVKEL